jgi:hypothetical protein
VKAVHTDAQALVLCCLVDKDSHYVGIKQHLLKPGHVA